MKKGKYCFGCSSEKDLIRYVTFSETLFKYETNLTWFLATPRHMRHTVILYIFNFLCKSTFDLIILSQKSSVNNSMNAFESP